MEFNVNIVEGIIIGVPSSLITYMIIKGFNAYRRSEIATDIQLLKYEKDHLEAMSKSSVELNRRSFRSLFSVLLFLSLGACCFTLYEMVASLKSPERLFFLAVALFFWFGASMLSYRFFKRYNNLEKLKDVVNQIEEKIERLESKLK